MTQAARRTHLPFYWKAAGGLDLEEGAGVMSGDTAAAAESGGREQTPEQSLEAGLLPSGLQVPARGRCWRSGLGFWVWT